MRGSADSDQPGDQPASHSSGTGLRRTLSVWQAVGLSIALMAPSMAANLNPQPTAGLVGRAVPLAFFLAALGVLLVAYGFVRMCQYFQHSGSVYAFTGATLGPRTGFVSGVGLLGTYTFFSVVVASATGILGTDFLNKIGVWPTVPTWAPFLLAGITLVACWVLAVIPAKRGTGVLLSIEGVTVAFILLVVVVVLVRLIAGDTPGGQSFDLSVFAVEPGSELSSVFLGVVFGFLSFAGFEAAATLGEETRNPRRDIPRAIVGTAIFGGLYYTIVTAVEMMAFGTDAEGVAAFGSSGSLLGDVGTAYIGSWVGDLITLGAAIGAFACCLACIVSASRMTYALARDIGGERGLGKASVKFGTPANAVTAVVVTTAVILLISVAFFDAEAIDTFTWFATIGTLILLVVYILTTIGSIRLVFVQRKLAVPMWQIVVPIAALVVLGYTVYRNVIPYPTEGAAQWYPVVAGGWLLAAIIFVVAAPRVAERVGRQLTVAEGLDHPKAAAQAVGEAGRGSGR